MNKKAILFVNLGSPTKPSALSIALYLGEFLSDKLVVNIPRFFWLPLLYLVILPLRSFRNVPKYRSIWLNKQLEKKVIKYMAYGSPLHFLSSIFLRKAQEVASQKNSESPEIRLVMRYGSPSISWGINELIVSGCDEILLFPLYPQFSYSTTEAVISKFRTEINKKKLPIKWQVVNSYAKENFYINALASQIKKHWQENPQAEKTIFSFHGLPKKMIDNGDPYQIECEQTTKLVREKLNMNENELIICYQSRFGKDDWIEPATVDTLVKLAKDGVKSVDVISPGFAVDCLETLEEVNMELREEFIKNGGSEYRYINCLNDDDVWINGIVDFAINWEPKSENNKD